MDRCTTFPMLLAPLKMGKAALMLLLVRIAVMPALIFPQHKQPKVTGMHPVATALFTYTNENLTETFTDAGEKRKVNVEFWYPADTTGDEKYPLVVFSHGSMGLKTGNTSTFMELASNGYVVCSIDHPYHAIFTRGSDGRVVTVAPSFRQELYDVNNGKYDTTTAPQAYEIVFPGTNHMSFTDLPLISPLLTSLLNGSVLSTRGSGADPLVTIEKMNATVLQFFNVYLRGEGSFTAAK